MLAGGSVFAQFLRGQPFLALLDPLLPKDKKSVARWPTGGDNPLECRKTICLGVAITLTEDLSVF